MLTLQVSIFLYLIVLILGKGFDPDNLTKKNKLRVCIVEGKGSYKRASKYCPTLEAKTNIECVVGVDRLDCIRRIHKGSAHFGVFSSEELVAARWAGVEILITHEMRFHPRPFEYEVVAIVDNEAGINSAQDLRGSKFCHPGHGLQNHWTDILANYFESTLIPKSCENDLTLTESRIKASANFFGPTCKAGPWVPDPVQDRLLKNRYPSLCQLCYNPYQCSIGDKHWGRRGPLYCLTSGAGEVAWVRLDDVKSHFGFSGTAREADPSGYSYLCPDGHLQPLDSKHPCVWVAKPWPAIAAKRSEAENVESLLNNLSHEDEESWQNALLNLIETYHVNVTSLDMAVPVDDFLDQAVGFQSAYSFPSCNPPRSIIFCTTSLIQHAKCSWLQEASSVFGIEPNLQCIRAEHLDRCLDDTKHKVADIVLVDQNERVKAQRDYFLKPLLYEYSMQLNDRYVVLAVVKAQSKIYNFDDLQGKKACFPSYEGAAYLSVLETLRNKSLANNHCPYSSEIIDFFSSDSCIWDPKSLNKCSKDYAGDTGALKCLADGGDVAFLSLEIYKNFTDGTLNETWTSSFKRNQFRVICPYGTDAKDKLNKQNYEFCYMHWTPHGHLMIHNDTTLMRRNEIYNSLRDMDRLFGKHYKTHTIPFTLFGPFDKKNNVMFRDSTDGFRGIVELHKDRAPRLMESTYNQYINKKCKNLSNIISRNNILIILTIAIILY